LTTESGPGLTFSGALTAAGRGVTKAGSGSTQFGSFEAAALNVIGGAVNFSAVPASSLNVNVTTLTIGQVTNIGSNVDASINFDSGSVTVSKLQLASLIQPTLTNNTIAGNSSGTLFVGGTSPNPT